MSCTGSGFHFHTTRAKRGAGWVIYELRWPTKMINLPSLSPLTLSVSLKLRLISLNCFFLCNEQAIMEGTAQFCLASIVRELVFRYDRMQREANSFQLCQHYAPHSSRTNQPLEDNVCSECDHATAAGRAHAPPHTPPPHPLTNRG